MAKLLLLSMLGLVLLLSLGQGKVLSAAGLNSVSSSEDSILDTVVDNVKDAIEDVIDVDGDDDDSMEEDEFTGFPVEDLDEDELNLLVDIEDEIFVGQVGKLT